MRHALMGMASCALALTLAIDAADAGTNDVNFKATRNITVDNATGKLRKPTAVEVEQLVTDLKRLTARKTAAATSAVAGETGGYSAELDGFDGVVLARPRSDGSFETRCVFSFEEGVEFLGLVAEETE